MNNLLKRIKYKPVRSNCLIWAIWACLNGFGKIKFTKSKLWQNGFHVYILMNDNTIISYVPLRKEIVSLIGGIVDFWFYGEIEIKKK